MDKPVHEEFKISCAHHCISISNLITVLKSLAVRIPNPLGVEHDFFVIEDFASSKWSFQILEENYFLSFKDLIIKHSGERTNLF